MSETVIEARDQMADLTEMIEDCAASVAYRYKGWAEYDDLFQEGWLWTLENRARVDEWLASDQSGLVVFWLRKAMNRYARKEKADRSGQSGEDQFFYTIGTIRRLLPVILTSDGSPPQAGGDIRAGRNSGADGSTTGDFEAYYVDIREAFKRLRQDQRDLLWRYYVEEVPGRLLATEAQVTENVITGRVRTAMLDMQKELGGPKP